MTCRASSWRRLPAPRPARRRCPPPPARWRRDIALSWITGGVMLGNCATGITASAISPASTITIETTMANFGRAMKKSEIIGSLSGCRLVGRDGFHHFARPDLLHASDDDLLALLQA